MDPFHSTNQFVNTGIIGGHSHEDDNREREQDRFLPSANILRIMKKVLPANAKIGKDGKECMQECVSEFISFITSEANERCLQEKRKTISGDDIIAALEVLGFDNYVNPLKNFLAKYRESLKGDKTEKRLKKDDYFDNDIPLYEKPDPQAGITSQTNDLIVSSDTMTTNMFSSTHESNS